MKKNPIVALSLAVAFVAGGMFSVPVHEMMQHPEIARAAVSDAVPEGYTPIYTIDDLYAVRNDLSGNYILMNDIDLSETAPGGDWDCGYGWKPIGGNEEGKFKGVFDGNGYAVKNMHIYGTPNANFLGLFGSCDYGASAFETKIVHLSLVDVDIDVQLNDSTQSDFSIGSIAGYAPNISECYVNGSIKVDYKGNNLSDTKIGGIAGENFRFIKNCFNACDLVIFSNCSAETYHNIGGISGYLNNGGISGCYNIGDIIISFSEVDQSKSYVGNIVGDGYNLLGTSNKLNTSYYNKANSLYTTYNYEAATSYAKDNEFSNVMGLTVGMMKSKSAYTGFDFDEVWTIDPNADYPYPTLRNVPYVSASEEQPTTEPTTEETEAPTYDPTEPGSNPSSDSPLKGDVNEDGVVNAVDASIILIYASKIGLGNDVSIDDLY